MLYRKGLEHGRALLFQNKKIQAAWGKSYDEFVAGTKSMKTGDLEAAVWTVANWSQLIALHLDSTQVLTEIPDWWLFSGARSRSMEPISKVCR